MGTPERKTARRTAACRTTGGRTALRQLAAPVRPLAEADASAPILARLVARVAPVLTPGVAPSSRGPGAVGERVPFDPRPPRGAHPAKEGATELPSTPVLLHEV